MKYLKNLIFLLITVLLVACSGVEENVELITMDDIMFGEIDYERFDLLESDIASIDDSAIIAELEELNPIFHITSSAGENALTGNVQLVSIDLTTGKTVETRAADGISLFAAVWDLGEGYFALREIDFENWDEYGDHETSLVIFDEYLNRIREFEYDSEAHPFLTASVLRLVDDELFVYGPVDHETTSEFLRVNMNTGEIVVLFVGERTLFFEKFINDHQILISNQVVNWDVETGGLQRDYGIFCLVTGEISFFENSDNFMHRNIDFSDSHILLTEPLVMGEEEMEELRNEVIIFDIENMSTYIVPLDSDQSLWARLSYDGKHIVTIDEHASVFRKFDFHGNVVTEVDIDIPELVPGAYMAIFMGGFEIFPLTENIYTIHSLGFPVERHIQFIRLP